MTPSEVTFLVSTLTKDFDETQRYELIGRVSCALLMAGGSTKIEENVHNPITLTPANKPVPPLVRGNVMIPEGFVCECDQCNKPVYKIIADVFENMGKKDFVACFKPLGNAPELAMPLDTWADSSGNLSIDCPLCKGTKSLWIKGKGDIPYSDVPSGGE